MKFPSVWSQGDGFGIEPFRSFRKEMEDMFRAFGQNSSMSIGASTPALGVAETPSAIEVTAELPGVDQNDVKVSLDANRLVISGEKKAESKRDEQDWHVEERSYGSFYRSLSLPFIPEDSAIQANLDKGVLHLTVNKPAAVVKAAKTIEIKSGAADR